MQIQAKKYAGDMKRFVLACTNPKLDPKLSKNTLLGQHGPIDLYLHTKHDKKVCKVLSK